MSLPSGGGLPPQKVAQHECSQPTAPAAGAAHKLSEPTRQEPCCSLFGNYWVARSDFGRHLDDAILRAYLPALWDVRKESASLSDFWGAQMERGSKRLSRLLPLPAALPPPWRPSDETSESNETRTQSGLRFAANVLSNATLISLCISPQTLESGAFCIQIDPDLCVAMADGYVFFFQILIFAATGPSYESFGRNSLTSMPSALADGPLRKRGCSFPNAFFTHRHAVHTIRGPGWLLLLLVLVSRNWLVAQPPML
jgi:hypothetical protein